MQTPLYRSNPNYVTELTHGKRIFVLFAVSTEMIPDVQKFIEGKYSEMSKDAKKVIFSTSTLPYNKTMGSFKMSNPILQALDKTRTLRTYLEDTLGIRALPDSYELIDPPSEEWYIENVIK